mmetsp:Transcript_23498/g.36785  ORF Transcript_23498/g.36785 Transcript_23498/m.36785 type:complete len:95 (-) Transcript_23498:165-449(-)
MVTHNDGCEGKTLAWSELIGHGSHNCSLLPGGKEITMARAIIYSEGSTEEEKKRVVEDVKNFINNARIARKNDEKVLDWKRKLLQELELELDNW